MITNAWFVKEGDWTYTVIDDKVGLDEDGQQVFSTCKDGAEMWLPLLEKAYAKLHGCYQAIDGGSGVSALVDITGGVAYSCEMAAAQEDPEAFWEEMNLHLSQGSGLYVCSCDGGVEEERADGLLTGHMYAALRTATVDGTKLIQVRNPWGSSEWTGAWSDGAEEWSEEALEELGYAFGDDGTFWMCVEDYVACWSEVQMCRLFSSEWKMVSDYNAFTGGLPAEMQADLRQVCSQGRALRTGELLWMQLLCLHKLLSLPASAPAPQPGFRSPSSFLRW